MPQPAIEWMASLAQCGILGVAWAIAGRFGVDEGGGSERYCHWQAPARHVQMLRDRAAPMADRLDGEALRKGKGRKREECRFKGEPFPLCWQLWLSEARRSRDRTQ